MWKDQHASNKPPSNTSSFVGNNSKKIINNTYFSFQAHVTQLVLHFDIVRVTRHFVEAVSVLLRSLLLDQKNVTTLVIGVKRSKLLTLLLVVTRSMFKRLFSSFAN